MPGRAVRASTAEHLGGGPNTHQAGLVQVVRLLKTPSAMCCVLQGVAGSLPWGVLLTFINDYLSQQQHLSVAHATLVRIFSLALGPLCRCKNIESDNGRGCVRRGLLLKVTKRYLSQQQCLSMACATQACSCPSVTQDMQTQICRDWAGPSSSPHLVTPQIVGARRRWCRCGA